VNNRWEVGITHSDGQFQQNSFVNAIATTKGGTHVTHACEKIVSNIVEIVAKKNKAAPVKPTQIKNYLWVFVNCRIENPSFSSQTKEHMTLGPAAFGSKCDLSDKFIKAVIHSGVIDKLLEWAKFKQASELRKQCSGNKGARLTGIPKLDDANKAGTRLSHQCTLILTEGDSAKTLAVSGLSVVGRDFYGVFPLKGKLLNVREATHKQIMGNSEIQNIVKIVGLKYNYVYRDISSLRYGSLMIMTDQDHDGSHIKGLIINFVHYFWPSLLKIPGFLVEFITPIVKVKKGHVCIPFYTIPEYQEWKSRTNTDGWDIKYYKGLGTSTPAEAKEYFQNLRKHKISFSWSSPGDNDKIELAFSKKKADDRKEWLGSFIPGTFLDQNVDFITYTDFIDKELVLFSMADNMRSIPSVMDGLKPGQRKVLFACFKRNLKKEIKVSQLAG
jgi:DNA topoisomerase-2